MDLDNKVALVTGSGRRLGREIALALGRAGADVVVHFGSSSAGAEATADALRSLGRRAWTVQADLANVDSLGRMFDAVGEQPGRLDVLVNSAASFESQPLVTVEPSDWDRVMAVNLRAPFFCMQRAAELMGAGDPPAGAIVNLGDLSGVSPWLEHAVHGTSKAGLLFLTECAARELGPDVRVNAVVPGPILPPPGMSADDDEWRRRGRDLPLQRTGEPRHIAEAVLFLIDNDYVTGAVLPVDGGERLLGLQGR